MNQHFHQIKAIGSIYVNSSSVQKYIKGIEFPSKQENIAGLQLADFIPNQIAKKVLGKKFTLIHVDSMPIYIEKLMMDAVEIKTDLEFV